jgi:hypothetical protein
VTRGTHPLGLVWKYQSHWGSRPFPRVGALVAFRSRAKQTNHLEAHLQGEPKPDPFIFRGPAPPHLQGPGGSSLRFPKRETVRIASASPKSPPPLLSSRHCLLSAVQVPPLHLHVRRCQTCPVQTSPPSPNSNGWEGRLGEAPPEEFHSPGKSMRAFPSTG